MNFQRQGLAISFYCKLGCRIKSLIGGTHHSTNRADIDNLSPTCLAHIREHCFAHIDHAKEICIHLHAHFFFGSQLQCSANSHTGIINQYIHPSLLGYYLFYSLTNRNTIRYINDKHSDLTYILRRFPARTVNDMTLF